MHSAYSYTNLGVSPLKRDAPFIHPCSMTSARYKKVDREHGGYYHITTQCVRQASLFGWDPVRRKRNDHRKDWLERRFLFLSQIFTVDIYTFAIMSNHYHLVVHYCPSRVHALSNREIAQRWLTLFPPPRKQNFDTLASMLEEDEERIQELRSRLADISWFMRCINEPLARMANAEDGKRGNFVAERYHVRVLKSDEELYACLAYDDLNPTRANVTKSPEQPQRTGLFRRLQEAKLAPAQWQEELRPLVYSTNAKKTKSSSRPGIGVTLKGYLELVYWTKLNIKKKQSSDPPTVGIKNSEWMDLYRRCKRPRRAPYIPLWMLADFNKQKNH